MAAGEPGSEKNFLISVLTAYLKEYTPRQNRNRIRHSRCLKFNGVLMIMIDEVSMTKSKLLEEINDPAKLLVIESCLSCLRRGLPTTAEPH